MRSLRLTARVVGKRMVNRDPVSGANCSGTDVTPVPPTSSAILGSATSRREPSSATISRLVGRECRSSATSCNAR